MKKNGFLGARWVLRFCSVSVLVLGLCSGGQASSSAVSWNVRVGHVKVADFPQYILALGSLSAIHAVVISPVVDGKISKIYFRNGQLVVQDDVIAQLDSQQAQAQVNKAKAAYVSQQQKYERYKQLAMQNIGNISRQELDDQRASLESAKAELQEKQADLDQLSIKAPFSGVLDEFQFNEGDYINAGDNLVSLVNKTELLANYNIPQGYLTDLKTGQTAYIKVKAFPKATFTGTVNFVSPTVNDSTRTVTVQALIPNPDGQLLPGMFVHVKQKIGTKKNVLVVPDQAVLADVKGYYVFQVVDGKASQVYVEIGDRHNGLAQIKKGIKAGATIVVLGQQKLQDGSSVTVLTGSAKPSSDQVSSLSQE